MTSLFKNVSYALRRLRNHPGTPLTILLTLALGIGVNTALFSVVNALLLHSLPYRDAERLIYVGEFWPHEPIDNPPSPDFNAWQTRGRSFDQLEAYGHTGVESSGHAGGMTLTGHGSAENIEGTNVTAGFLPLLGVRPVLGRNFSAEEDRRGGALVAILGHKFWQRHFASSPNVIGNSIQLDGKSCTIVGVLPASFVFPDNNFSADILIPMQLDPAPGWNERTFRMLRVLARPKPGVSTETMRKEFADIVQSTRDQEPPQFITMRKDMQITATTLRERLSGNVRPWLLILQAVVVMVLLIACLNVASLQIGSALSRQKEIAVRTSLGATRAQVARQLLTESLLLSLLAGIAGTGVGAWALHYLVAFLPANLHLLNTAYIDVPSLLFTLCIAVSTGIVTGLAPLATAYAVSPGNALKADGGRSTSAAGHHQLRRALVIAEVAIATILLMGSGLLIRSFTRLRAVDLGFDAHDVLTMKVRLSYKKYESPESRIRFFSQLLERAQSMPDMQEASIASGLPLIGAGSGVGAVVEEKPAPPPGGAPTVPLTQIVPNYFRTLGMPLLRGRYFNQQDRENSLPVVIVNQTFAQQYFPGQEAIGKHVKFGSMSKGPWYEIVGIVGDVRQQHVRLAAPPNLYVPYRQHPDDDMFLILKSARSGVVSGLQASRLVQEIDPDQPVDDIATMESRVADSLAADRANMTLLGIFAGVALALAAIGIFAVIAYFVSQHTHEIGVRIALGAQRSGVLWLVLKPGLVMAVTGIFLGLIGAMACTRILRTSLYGISADDPATMAAISTLFLLIASAACYIPARRAASVEPMQALRTE